MAMPAYPMDRADELEAENQALRQLLHTLTSDAAYNEGVMRRFQERELALLGAQDLPDLIERLTIGLRSSFNLESVRLVLFDPYGVLEELLAALGAPACNIPHLFIEREVQQALDRYPDLHRPWLGPWVRRHQPFPAPANLRSEALLPLRQPDGLSGFLHLGASDPRRFHAGQGTDFLDHLARLAAVCLENAVNRERLRLSGLTDGLTGLYNRRHLDTRLAEEVSRARRHRLALSCLFIDADHFKRINDEHGHAAGDQVLIALAKRIRAAVTAKPVVTTDGVAIPVTVSIGVARLRGDTGTHPETAATRLIEEADAQAYRAKTAGRDRVCAADAPL
ncbi:GGDEF domain-containing protein [endosymbiont of unidentified scaly snail isolate Monju]|uniref:GGDEF domain-containing protein n=1 Tax=endosymbiont of unidentified scaly snail isolate Monju TaxID=1248727 RepID=UPI0003892344|nr:DUF484 family protein [endosymbiont of unidentified scaly snail isolate Monju]BAN70132.1 signal transduction protein [endosymbiont of unidentified scaly snail isolate Monju]